MISILAKYCVVIIWPFLTLYNIGVDGFNVASINFRINYH